MNNCQLSMNETLKPESTYKGFLLSFSEPARVYSTDKQLMVSVNVADTQHTLEIPSVALQNGYLTFEIETEHTLQRFAIRID